jgi:membrane fusion protein (multidrug efflux system)
VGTLTAVNGADLSSESSGTVTDIRFQSGQKVQKGDALIVLDNHIETAEVKNDAAELKLAQMNYARFKSLTTKNMLAQSEMDAASAKLQEAEAALEAATARLNQKTVSAPFAGKVGIHLVNVGEFVPAGTAMVTLQVLDPLYVQFHLPEQYLPDIYLLQPVEVLLDHNQKVFARLSAINAKVDKTTREVLVQATLANPNETFYPGMFAQVKVLMKKEDHVVTLPQTAISYSLHGDAVYIVKPDPKKKDTLIVQRQYVRTGERREDQVAILEGVKAGDQVVTSGQLKLQNGTHVVIDNSVEF